MGLIQGKGKPIPEVPKVRLVLRDSGEAVTEVYGDLEFYLLECGHRMETANANPVDMAFNQMPCLRCWEALLGTKEAE